MRTSAAVGDMPVTDNRSIDNGKHTKPVEMSEVRRKEEGEESATVVERLARVSLTDETHLDATKQPQDIESALLHGRCDLAEYYWQQSCMRGKLLPNKICSELATAAVQSGKMSSICFLTEHDVALDCVNGLGETALHIAAKCGSIDIAEYLATSGIVPPNATDDEQNTPLHVACIHGNSDIVVSLSAVGVDRDVRNQDWDTALLCAVKHRNRDCVFELLKAGARVDLANQNGDTPLHLACMNGDESMVAMLSNYMPDLDVYNRAGYTPLHLASKTGHLEIVRTLLVGNADTTRKNSNGISADVMAFAQGHKDVGMLLTKMKSDRRRHWREQLLGAGLPLPRIKLKLFGSTMVGKTELTGSIKAGYLTAYFHKHLSTVAGRLSLDQVTQHTRRSINPHEWTSEAQHEQYTRGINIHTTNEFSLWDFSGYEPYYFIYDHFVGDLNCLHVVILSLLDAPSWRLASVRFWLDFIHARVPITQPLLPGGKPSRTAQVIMVATHADCVPCRRDGMGLFQDESASQLLQTIRQEYGTKLDICDTIYCLDARDATSLELKHLKTHLLKCRETIIQALPQTNPLLLEVASRLPEWSATTTFPVDTWEEFADRIRTLVNPLCTNEHLSKLIQHLQYTGNVVYIESPTSDDMIAVSPHWLCTDLLGIGFSQESLQNSRVTGSYTVDDFQLRVRQVNTIKLVILLEALGICVCCVVQERRFTSSSQRSRKAHEKQKADFFQVAARKHRPTEMARMVKRTTMVMTYSAAEIIELKDELPKEDIQFELPGLNQITMDTDMWEQPVVTDARELRYTALEVTSCPVQLVHLMPRIQLRLRTSIDHLVRRTRLATVPEKRVRESSVQYDLNQWLHGSKVTLNHGAAEILITIHRHSQMLMILARCTPRFARKTFTIVHNALGMIRRLINHLCPGLEINVRVIRNPATSTHGYLEPDTWSIQTLAREFWQLYSNSPTPPASDTRNTISICTDRLEEECVVVVDSDELKKDVFFDDEFIITCAMHCHFLTINTMPRVVVHHLAHVLDNSGLSEKDWAQLIHDLNSHRESHMDRLLQQPLGADGKRQRSITETILREHPSRTMDCLIRALKRLELDHVVDFLYQSHLLFSLTGNP